MTYFSDRADRRPTYVYRLFAEDGALLYVGCSVNVEQRLRMHHVSDFVTVTSVRYETRARARAAERAAIETEAPLLNKAHNPTRFRFVFGGGYEPVTQGAAS